MTTDPIWDDLWHGVAFEAFVRIACEQQGWPDSDAVKKLAYSLYEAELRASQKPDSQDRQRAGGTRR